MTKKQPKMVIKIDGLPVGHVTGLAKAESTPVIPFDPFGPEHAVPKPSKIPYAEGKQFFEMNFAKMLYGHDVSFALIKGEVLEDEDGLLTKRGMEIIAEYATAWVKRGARSLELERRYPEFGGFFYDLRVDPDLAAMHAAG
jgi:hypothetical protein